MAGTTNLLWCLPRTPEGGCIPGLASHQGHTHTEKIKAFRGCPASSKRELPGEGVGGYGPLG